MARDGTEIGRLMKLAKVHCVCVCVCVCMRACVCEYGEAYSRQITSEPPVGKTNDRASSSYKTPFASHPDFNTGTQRSQITQASRMHCTCWSLCNCGRLTTKRHDQLEARLPVNPFCCENYLS